MDKQMSTENIQTLIKSSNVPLVFKGILSWKILQWGLQEWSQNLGSIPLRFRLGKFVKTKEPQWEKSTESVHGTFKEFLEFDNKDDWLYFDYKYLRDWFEENSELKQDIKWDAFGFDNLGYKESTIWIGNKGAHTPCHIDTYGCNLVAQVYGKKQWLLFPKEENLNPTRVPYEESSIYSKYNFFSPDFDQLKGIQTCRRVVLNPGDVLFVPQGWWHYVENLEVAISVNTWIPLADDVSRQLEEAIVQLLVAQFAKNKDLMSDSSHEHSTPSFQESLNILHHYTLSYKEYLSSTTINKMGSAKGNLGEIEADCSSVTEIPILDKKEFEAMILERAKKFHDNKCEPTSHEDKSDPCSQIEAADFLNMLTSQDVIASIKYQLLQCAK